MAVTPQTRPERERRAYIIERITHLREELKALRTEKATVVAALREEPKPLSPEARKVWRRRIYVTKRPEDAKAELAALVAEQKSMAPAAEAAEASA